MNHLPQARKRFGQHFLVDNNIIENIVDLMAIKKDDCVIEIGPGPGALTAKILEKTAPLQVVEIDRDLVDDLKKRYPEEKLIVHQQNALTFDFSALYKGKPLKIVGNLPYNISTPLIFHLLEHDQCIADMTFMLQKEVVQRMCAPVNSPHYGRLSVMVQYAAQVKPGFEVPPNAFIPPPKVWSQMVTCVPYTTKPFIAKDEKRFAEVVRTAFSHRRKTLHNALKGLITDPTIWEKCQIDANLRPENCSVEMFVKIANQ